MNILLLNSPMFDTIKHRWLYSNLINFLFNLLNILWLHNTPDALLHVIHPMTTLLLSYEPHPLQSLYLYELLIQIIKSSPFLVSLTIKSYQPFVCISNYFVLAKCIIMFLHALWKKVKNCRQINQLQVYHHPWPLPQRQSTNGIYHLWTRLSFILKLV